MSSACRNDRLGRVLRNGKTFIIVREKQEHGGYTYNPILEFPASITPNYNFIKTVSLVRDPVETYALWKTGGYERMDEFIKYHEAFFRLVKALEAEKICCIIYERLISQTESEMERICEWWGIPFFGDNIVGSGHPLTRLLFESESESHCSEGESSEIPKSAGSSHRLLSNIERELIEISLGKSYLHCWKAAVDQIHATLQKKTWFGFDLDDTLHEFRLASGSATNATLAIIAHKSKLTLEELKKTYSKVLAQSTSGAFVDGKSSYEYRKERFSAVLQLHSILCSEEFLDELLKTYEMELTQSLQLKCGVLDLFHAIKAEGKKIVVITEGPQDAQERTIQALGLSDKIDFLATTNFFRRSKVDGLFTQVLNHLKISASDIVYVGDSEQRDMEPATKENIYAIHLAEKESISLDVYPPKINTLKKLEFMLSGV